MHADRLNFWTVAYENEKKLLLQQYTDEMDSYKERKFRAHKELECVHYGLEALADERQKLIAEKQEEKVYEIKSKVSDRLRINDVNSQNYKIITSSAKSSQFALARSVRQLAMVWAASHLSLRRR